VGRGKGGEGMGGMREGREEVEVWQWIVGGKCPSDCYPYFIGWVASGWLEKLEPKANPLALV
jgi:hypothetical protein